MHRRALRSESMAPHVGLRGDASVGWLQAQRRKRLAHCVVIPQPLPPWRCIDTDGVHVGITVEGVVIDKLNSGC
jgi:hypothetical protein